MTTKYANIASDLEEKIRNGQYHDRLPNERELCALYGVSRNTISQALQQLEQKNLIYRKHGSGTYVRDIVEIEKHNVNIHLFTDGFTKSAETDNVAVSTEILNFKMAFAGKLLTDKLNVSAKTPLYEVIRLRLINGQPACYEINVIPIALLPNLTPKDMQGSLFQYASAELGLKVANAAVEVTAPTANPSVLEALNLTDATSQVVIRSEGTVFLENGKPLEFFDTYYRPEYFNLKANTN